MKSNVLLLIGAFLLTFLLGAFISKIVGDKKLDRLKVFSDSVAVVAEQRDSNITKLSDSVDTVVGELENTKHALVIATTVNRRKDIKLDSALAVAATASDSNNIRGEQVVNLRQENVTLRGALAISDNQLTIMTENRDSALNALHTATRDIITLKNEIHGLHPKLPKLVRYGIEGAKLGITFYAGVKYGQSHP